MNDFSGLYNIRTYQPSDKPLVISTWLRGLYYGDTWFNQIPKNIFMQNYKTIVEKIIDHPNTLITIACLPDDPDVILGYSALTMDTTTMHWVFVKKAWRQKGIGKSLTPINLKQVSHLSDLGRSLLKTKFKTIIFNPFSV